jgi:hypothetical protein
VDRATPVDRTGPSRDGRFLVNGGGVSDSPQYPRHPRAVPAERHIAGPSGGRAANRARSVVQPTRTQPEVPERPRKDCRGGIILPELRFPRSWDSVGLPPDRRSAGAIGAELSPTRPDHAVPIRCRALRRSSPLWTVAPFAVPVRHQMRQDASRLRCAVSRIPALLRSILAASRPTGSSPIGARPRRAAPLSRPLRRPAEGHRLRPSAPAQGFRTRWGFSTWGTDLGHRACRW